MTNQLATRFRKKKLSNKQPLPIYKESQLSDLGDISNLQRADPQIETGVEKEEEEEHDLKAALSAAQNYIPTPDASHIIDIKEYDALYKRKFKEPSILIRFSTTVEDSTGCPYVLDDEDDGFLKQYNRKNSLNNLTEDHLEFIMWELESITNKQLPNLSNDILQLPDYDSFQSLLPPNSNLLSDPTFQQVFEYWRRKKQQRLGKPIIPTLAYEDILKHEVDPYVCFRRRETKSFRKTRRSDQQSLDKLRRIRADMETARNLLEMVVQREKIRKECLEIEQSVFEKSCLIREHQRTLGIQEDDDILISTPKKKRKLSADSNFGTTIKIPLHKLKSDSYNDSLQESPLQIAIKTKLARRKTQDTHYEDITECPFQPFPPLLPQHFFQPLYTLYSNNQTPQLQFRKRYGRNGRLYLDRKSFQTNLFDTSNADQSSANNISTALKRYQFDSDLNDGDDSDLEIDDLEDSGLLYRSKLLNEADLRNLVSIPFSTPSSINSTPKPNIQQSKSNLSQAANTSNIIPNNNSIKNINSHQPIPTSPIIIKRQNSQNKSIPQQTAKVN
ncbi:enhancer of polycomb-like-domain-containing protein [Cunninghamella echinulata]|nr:enhancer of polycomb-like-domain-containing protein [Cunninghamella echinulata]